MLTPQTASQITALETDPDPRNDDGFSEALSTLHTRSVDALAGYTKMVEKAVPEFRSVAEQFRALHAAHADRLAQMLASHGHTIDAAGSFMGTVNKAVVSVRAMFDEIDSDVMDNIRSGEENVLKAFDDALLHETHATHQQALREMRDELVTLLDQTRHLD